MPLAALKKKSAPHKPARKSSPMPAPPVLSAPARKPMPSPAPARMQAKLEIGPVGDRFEQEADRTADSVMRMPDPAIAIAAAPLQISRKCAICEKEEKDDKPLQKTSTGPAEVNMGEAPVSVHAALRSPGQPLDKASRAYFEPRFGQEFGHVRVHTGMIAAQSAREVSARAYTVGPNIVFAAGRFAPGTQTGRRLIAHELTHVVQQQGRDTIYRQMDEGQILAEIQMLRMNLMAPVNPLAEMQRARLIQLEAMLGKAAGTPAPPSKPSPSLDLPFDVRVAQAWTQAKEAARRKISQEDESGSSTWRNMIKISDLVPTPRDVWKTGIYARLFKNDEWGLVEEYSLHRANETFEKRYQAAKYGNAYGEEDKVSGERSNTDVDIWYRGRRFGLFLPSEKAAVLNISAIGIARAASLNLLAKTVDLNSPEAVTLRDEIHRFTDDPAVVLLGPEMERLFGPYEYKYSDEANRGFAADKINQAYKKSLGNQILGDPNASVQQRWTECLSIRGFKENNVEQAVFDPKCFHSQAEFVKEYYRRVGELERRKVAECPSGGPDKYTCQNRLDLEYRPTGTAQKDYAMRQAYQEYQEHVESIVSGGGLATLGRLSGYVAAKFAGRDEDEALRWSEGGAVIGSFGDAALTIKAGATARTGFQNYKEGGGFNVSRDVPMTPPPQNVASPPPNEPIPTPVETSTPSSTAVADPWAGSVTRPVDLSKNLQTAEPPAVTTAKKTQIPPPAPAGPSPLPSGSIFLSEPHVPSFVPPSGGQGALPPGSVFLSQPQAPSFVAPSPPEPAPLPPGSVFLSEPAAQTFAPPSGGQASLPPGSVFSLEEITAFPELSSGQGGLDPSKPLDPSSFEPPSAGPAPTTFREALDQIDIDTIKPELVKSLRDEYRLNYSKQSNRALKTEDDYVRFRGGHISKQWKDPVGSTGEFQLYAALGRGHEIEWSRISGSPRNPGVGAGGRFRTPWGNVDPDFVPAIVRGSEVFAAAPAGVSLGDNVAAWDAALRENWDPLLVADSKHFQSGIHGLTDQMRGFIWLAQFSESRSLVIVGREGDRVTSDIADFAKQHGVSISIRPFGR